MNDAAVKCATHELHITLCVKYSCGHLKPFNYLIDYNQYHLVLLLQSKGNLSEYVLHSYIISASTPKDCKI